MLRYLFFALAFVLGIAPSLNAQDYDSLSVEEFTAPSISLNPTQEAQKKKEQKAKEAEKAKKGPKRPKTEFYGIKTQKIIIKNIKGRTTTVERFHILTSYKDPNPYVYEKYIYNPKDEPKKRKIIEIPNPNAEKGMPLHGTYERRVNGEIREKGIYYLGVKHGRWVRYAQGFILEEKEYYTKGFPKESQITYYDNKQTKISEVVPIQNGKKNGRYTTYYPNGRMKEMGMYERDKKVGVWYEYYDDPRGFRKRMYRYPDDPFDPAEGKLMKEWEASGKILINNGD